jgi:CBS domain containing-hemolysin-like protein
MTLLLILSLVILLLSFLASSTEAALFSVSNIEVERMSRRGTPAAARMRRNKERIHDAIIALVVLNNLANIAGSILVGVLAAHVFSSVGVGIFSAALTLVIIVVGEIIPKVIGERYAAPYALHMSGFIAVVRNAFRPVVFMLDLLVRPFRDTGENAQRVTEEEFATMVDMSLEDGAILASEDQLIRRVLQLDTILAGNIMTPRTVVFALQADQTLGEAASALYQAAVSRIPLYGQDLDDIVGVAHIRDLLSALARGKGDRPLRDFGDEVSFVPDTAHADALLRTFQRNREHLAVVVDEHGGVAGVITLEDILEQLVGEIVDEHDRDVDLRVRARMLRERKKGDQRRTGRKEL